MAVDGTSLYDNGNHGYGRESACIDGSGRPSFLEYRLRHQHGIEGRQGRGVPGIALDASPHTGSIVAVNGRRQQMGDTRPASPLFVGLCARIESATDNRHDFVVLGFHNTVPSGDGLSHDVVNGNTGGRHPYQAAEGWHHTTGFGSPITDPLARTVAVHPSF